MELQESMIMEKSQVFGDWGWLWDIIEELTNDSWIHRSTREAWTLKRAVCYQSTGLMVGCLLATLLSQIWTTSLFIHSTDVHSKPNVIHFDRCWLQSGKPTGAIPALKEPSLEFCRKCGRDEIPSPLVLSLPLHTIGVIKGGLGVLHVPRFLGFWLAILNRFTHGFTLTDTFRQEFQNCLPPLLWCGLPSIVGSRHWVWSSECSEVGNQTLANLSASSIRVDLPAPGGSISNIVKPSLSQYSEPEENELIMSIDLLINLLL